LEGSLHGFQKGLHGDIKGFQVLYKKGATFLRAFLPFQKGHRIVFVLIAVLWLILSFCPLARSTPARVKQEG